MPEITEQQLLEYQMLQKKYGIDAIQESILSTKTLKDDIDKPILKVVVGLALLGCQPVWSCCGFDYFSQPIHKRHDYGSLFIRCVRNDSSVLYLPAIQSIGRVGGVTISLEDSATYCLLFRWKPQFPGFPWPPEDMHYYGESAQLAIGGLERGIVPFEKNFAESVVIADANGLYGNTYRWWQYPKLGDWTVTMLDYLDA